MVTEDSWVEVTVANSLKPCGSRGYVLSIVPRGGSLDSAEVLFKEGSIWLPTKYLTLVTPTEEEAGASVVSCMDHDFLVIPKSRKHLLNEDPFKS